MEINSKTENKNIEQTAFGILLTVSFCHLLDDTMHSMLPAIYPMLKDEFGLSFLQIGIITFVLQITSSIIQPFVGLYADKHHSWWQLPVSMIFTLIGIFMLSYANSFYVILLSVSLFGLGSSIFHPQGSQVAQQASGRKEGISTEYFPGRRQRRLRVRSSVCSPYRDTCRAEWCPLVCIHSHPLSHHIGIYRKMARQTDQESS